MSQDPTTTTDTIKIKTAGDTTEIEKYRDTIKIETDLYTTEIEILLG